MEKHADADAIPRYLTLAEMKRLLAAARKGGSKRDHALLMVAYRHGLRASELGRLRRDDVDLASNRITVRRLKGSMGGCYSMGEDEAATLRAYLRMREDDLPALFLSRNHRPISRGQVHLLMQHYGGLAKLPTDRRHAHVLKHSLAVHLVQAGVGVLEIRDLLGHRSISSTMHYVTLFGQQRDRAMATALASGKIA